MKHIFLLALLCPFLSNCQPLSLNGKIIDEQAEPIAGATVTINRTKTSVIANDGGRFTISNLHLGDTLTFSAVGYEPSMDVYDLSLNGYDLTVVLKRKMALLKEVVINTGYQTVPKERATGSFSGINNQQLNRQITTNILSRLESLANGLAVDRTTSSGRLMIRGLSTIRGPKDPLIIIDNFPYDGDMTNINPNDVESITILKDAAAASIWGARAGNGVIVITTKKGRFSGPLSVELVSNFTVTSKPDLSQLKPISTSDFIDVEGFLFSKNYYNAQLNAAPPSPLSPVVETLYKKAAGQINPAEADAYINSLRSLDLRDQYNRYIYGQGLNQQHALTLRGGSSNLAWLFSAGFDRNRDELSSSFQRYNLRWQNTWKLTPNWQFTSSALFTNTGSGSGEPAWGSISVNSGTIYPYAQFAAPGGTPLALTKNYRQVFIDTAGGGKLLNWNYYPLEEYRHNTATNNTTDVLLSFGTQYTIINGLALDLKYGFEKQTGTSRLLMDEESYYTRDLINRFSAINRTTGTVTYRIPRGSILDLSASSVQSHNARASLNYTRSWNQHNLVLLLGNELKQTAYFGNAFRTYGYNDNILTSLNVDLATPYPTFFNGSPEYIPSNNSFYRSLNRFVSFFGNAAYTVRQKYTATISARKDASNLFGVAANNKWNPLWSAGLAWQLSKEAWFHLSALPYLKLRATYGFSGNTDPNMAAVTTVDYLSASPYTGTPYARFANYANPELRWERIAMLNLALDFASKNNRIEGSIEYYRKKGKDLFGTAPNDYTTGIGSTVIKNVAAMQGNGLDLQLATVNLRGFIQWSSDLNFSFYTDKISSYYIANKQGRNFIGGTGTANISGVEGKPVYSVFSYKWAGLDGATGDPRGILNGLPSSNYSALMGASVTVDSLAYSGPALPKFFGSFGNTFSWKNLVLDIRLLYKLGYYFRRSSINYSTLFSAWAGHSDYEHRWQKPGDEEATNIPSMVYPASSNRDAFYAGSRALIEQGDHLRLQYITLSYNWQRHRGNFPFSNIGFMINAANLGIIWRANKQNLDPEYRNNTLPPVRTIAFGIKTNI